MDLDGLILVDTPRELMHNTDMESTLDPELHDQIWAAAVQVRDWAERLSQRRQCSHRDDLCGYCAIASARLWSLLRSQGIPAELHEAETALGNHVFVVVDDHLVDVTATQFQDYRDQSVVICHRRWADHQWWWRTVRVHESAADLRRHQSRVGWPRNQIALPAKM